MNVFRMLGALCLVGSIVPTALALPPIGKEIKIDPKIKKAADSETFKHGMRLAITLNDKNRVLGTLVWADDSADYMLVRVKPGAPPRKIAGKDIAGIDRIRLTNSSGNVLADEPEIHQVTVINGDARSVKYFAPALSASEKVKLAEMEIAENDMSRAESMVALTMQSLKEEVQQLSEQLAYQKQRNRLMDYYIMYTSAGYFFDPTRGGYRGAYGYPTYYAPGYAGYSGQPANAGAVFDSILTKEITLGNHLSKLRRNLVQAQNFGLYDGERLVAIRLDGSEKTASVEHQPSDLPRVKPVRLDVPVFAGSQVENPLARR